MQLSIITVTYNSLSTLKDAYASLCAQTFSQWEWVLQDGASTDGTMEWVRSLNDLRISAQSEQDNGIYDALNKAVSRTTGEVIGLLHSDDLYPNTQVLTQVATAFEKGVDGVYGDLNYVMEHDIKNVLRLWKSCTFDPALLHKGWMSPHPTLFLRKEIYLQVGPFDTQFKIAADYDFILRVFAKPEYTYTYLPKTLMLMRQGGASSKLSNLLAKSKEDLRVMRKNGLPFPFFVLLRKVSSKFDQFFKK
jgi:glycosyltransferase